MNNNFRLSYEYESGDDPGTKTNEQFDPLWGRWPQFSEIIPLLDKAEARIGETTNMHRIGFGWTIDPTKKDEICTDYHLLFADENTKAGLAGFSNDGHFRGQLITFLYKHTFNDHIKGLILNEFFFPGNYYNADMNDVGIFIRAELFFTW